ncbi:hypothetical protein AURDEDRAFT_132047, partial [Auricularia subglabra TFB-10046 SS5]
ELEREDDNDINGSQPPAQIVDEHGPAASPRLPALLSRLVSADEERLNLCNLLATARPHVALKVMLADGMSGFTAGQLLIAMFQDEEDGFSPGQYMLTMARISRKLTTTATKHAKVHRNPAKTRLNAEYNKLYNQFIQDAHAMIHDLVKDGARKFNKSEGVVRNRIFTKTCVSHPKPLLWQAYVHVKSKELNEGLPKGQRKRLREIQRVVRAEQPHYTEQSKEEQAEWLRILQEYNTDRNVLPRTFRLEQAELSDAEPAPTIRPAISATSPPRQSFEHQSNGVAQYLLWHAICTSQPLNCGRQRLAAGGGEGFGNMLEDHHQEHKVCEGIEQIERGDGKMGNGPMRKALSRKHTKLK